MAPADTIVRFEPARFVVVCPAGHQASQTVKYVRLLEPRGTDPLVFYCSQCNRTWPPTDDELIELKRQVKTGEL
jgi:hypothetical protein